MKSVTRFLILFWIMFRVAASVTAQNPEGRFLSFEDLVESLSEESDNEEEFSSVIQELQELNQHPVPLNSAGMDELLRIPFLNEITASAILEYRGDHGGFFSKYELASVPGVSRDIAEKISFFVTTEMTGEYSGGKNVSGKNGVHQVLVRTGIGIPVPAGYRPGDGKPAAFSGSPSGYYVRYLYEKTGSVQAGITADKDPGEPFFKRPNRSGFDFYSAHISLRINKYIPEVVAGDYTLRTGQGLVCWQGFSIGKSSAALQSSKNLSQLKPYTSTNENIFFRGGAILFRSGNKSICFFLSSKKSDGNLAGGNDGLTTFSSLQSSGYHRTTSEIEDKRSVRHSVAGAVGSFYTDHVKIGVTVLAEKFQYPFVPGDQLYEKFYFTGKKNFNVGTDYHWITGKIHLYGEAAFSQSGGFAVVNGLEALLHDQVSAAFSFRHFDKTYQATWASAFAANSKANNETGFYAGIRMLPAAGIEISANLDGYYSPWIKYTTAAPSRGFEYCLQGDIKINRRLSGYIRFKNRDMAYKTTGLNVYINSARHTGNLRLHCRYDIGTRYALTWRAEINRTGSPHPETGVMCLQDVSWTPPKDRFSAIFRVAWFRIPSFDSRIYVFENDVLYAFSTISLFGAGFRSYLRFKLQPVKNLEIWCKLGSILYPGVEKISSGPAEIKGNLKSDLKLQFRYRF